MMLAKKNAADVTRPRAKWPLMLEGFVELVDRDAPQCFP
jgi:hypothetical protein